MKVNRLSLAGEVKRGCRCWEGAQGTAKSRKRDYNCVCLLGAACFAVSKACSNDKQITLQCPSCIFQLLANVASGNNNRGLYSLWYTHSQHCLDNKRQPVAAVCSHPVEREAKQLHIKAIVKTRFANSVALRAPVQLSFENLPVWVGIMSWGLLGLRVRGWLSGLAPDVEEW